MQKQFVTYEIALKFKELGFNEPCLAIYTHNNEHYTAGTFFLHTPHPYTIEELTPTIQDIRESTVYIIAPLWQQVIDWFREKFYMELSIQFDDNSNKYYYFLHTNIRECYSNRICSLSNSTNRIFNTYLDVREAAILKAIEIIKKK